MFIRFVVAAIRVHPESEDLGQIIDQTVDSSDYRQWLVDDSLDANLDPNQAEEPPLFIIVDTLARCFDGDENQQEDMGNFIKGLDLLREAHDATVLVVHHTSKEGFDERGSSAFRGACDTMMFASKEESEITLKCTKQKDAQEFPDETYELIVVPEWDSCAVQATALRLAHERDDVASFLAEKPDTPIREIAEALGLSKSSVHRRIQEIKKGQK
jgi:RecA-family ATPase